jgi:hypothetical protein
VGDSSPWSADADLEARGCGECDVVQVTCSIITGDDVSVDRRRMIYDDAGMLRGVEPNDAEGLRSTLECMGVVFALITRGHAFGKLLPVDHVPGRRRRGIDDAKREPLLDAPFAPLCVERAFERTQIASAFERHRLPVGDGRPE